MQAIDLLKIGKNLLEMMSDADIKASDYRYINLYDEYLRLRQEGHKYEYATTLLSQRYKISHSSVIRLIRRLGHSVRT